MLKGKKGIYILLPVVVFVWGAIIYQVIDAFSEEEPVYFSEVKVNTKEIKTVEREKFELAEITRDPFLGKAYVKKKIVQTAPKTNKKREEIQWPQIQYKGKITGSGTQTAVFLINIAGQEHVVSKRETVNEITVLRGNDTTITLRYKGKQKQFSILN